MANKPIAMSKLKTLIRLYIESASKSKIARSTGLSRNTVKSYLQKIESLSLSREDLLGLKEQDLFKLLQEQIPQPSSGRIGDLYRFFRYMEKELKKPGVTRKLLWQEYNQQFPGGYQLSQFNHHFVRWRGTETPSFKIDHKAGDKQYIDYTGKKLPYLDEDTGEVLEAEVFVSILGASQLIYVEASASQKKEDLIDSVQSAFQYYGGVPQAIVPDNLKSAVKKSHRYEPTINEMFQDFADHYQTVVLPARAYRPKDKALVEGAVKIIYREIYAHLRNRSITNLKELNEAIRPLLEQLNNRKLTTGNLSRRQLFNEVESKYLKPLPAHSYQIKETTWVTVMKTGHVLLHKDKHYYSVPYKFIGKKVKLVWSKDQVKIYVKFQCVATHKRSKSAYNYTTEKQHLASTHKFITDWSPDYFRNWAKNIHPHVEQLIIEILEKKKYPEQAYRSCMGVLSLTKKVGEIKLAAACSKALEYDSCNYKTVADILQRGLGFTQESESKDLPEHQNIRGNEYYK